MEFKIPYKPGLIFLLATISSSVSLAQPCSPCNFNGYAIGAGLGATTFMTNINSNASVVDVFPPPPGLMLQPSVVSDPVSTFSANDDLYRYGGMGNVFVSYGNVFSNGGFLGAELGLNIFGATGTSQKGSASNSASVFFFDLEEEIFAAAIIDTSINSKTTVNRRSLEPYLDIKGGFLITPYILGYLRAGLNYNQINIKHSASYHISADAIPSLVPEETVSATSSVSNSSSRTGLNWRAGIGMEVMLCSNVSVAADYVYTWYRKPKTSGNAVGTDVLCNLAGGCEIIDTNIANSSSAKISDQEVLAKLIYHFA